MTSSRYRMICLFGAMGFACVAGVLWYRLISLDAPQWLIPAAAFLVLTVLTLGAALMRGGWYQRWIGTMVILAAVTGFMLGTVELACRAIRLDFNELLGARRANQAFPIYFRQPTHPSGQVFFTRTPNAVWTGKPLQSLLKNHRSTDLAYQDEKEVTIQYSREGFRNPDALMDWDVAVVGDSFTESGYLPDDVIFTGITAARSGLRVKNLGITDSGTYSHIHYLETYARAPSCKFAVLAFFEGNDLNDNVREVEALDEFQKTGVRPSHEIPIQPSILKAIWTLVRDFKKLAFHDRSYANAYFESASGQIPVSIADAPPTSAKMTADEIHALETALDRYAESCQKFGMQPYLLFLPAKRRVMHGRLRQGENYPNPDWELGDLPEHIAGECSSRSINFIDATLVLTQAAAEGRNTFNTIYDTHFNAEGHRVVGELLAESLQSSNRVPKGDKPRE